MEKFSILLVDDIKDSRTLIQMQILQLFPSATIVHADNGHIAFNKMSIQKFDLLMTDIQMPRMTGDKLIESIEELPPKFRPTAIIAFSVDEEKEKCLKKIPKLVFLKKPFDTELLECSIHVLLKELKEKKVDQHPKIDVNFINPFIESAIKVLATTCFLESKKEDVYIKEQKQTSGDVSALIAMNCSRFKGSMAISFQKDCYLKVVGKMLDEEYNELIPDIHDVVGELCNQIFGLSKTKLHENGFDIQPALPSIIIGDNHIVKHLFDGPCIAIKFSTSVGIFYVETIVSANE